MTPTKEYEDVVSQLQCYVSECQYISIFNESNDLQKNKHKKVPQISSLDGQQTNKLVTTDF
jgi:hypothetical protein